MRWLSKFTILMICLALFSASQSYSSAYFHSPSSERNLSVEPFSKSNLQLFKYRKLEKFPNGSGFNMHKEGTKVVMSASISDLTNQKAGTEWSVYSLSGRLLDSGFWPARKNAWGEFVYNNGNIFFYRQNLVDVPAKGLVQATCKRYIKIFGKKKTDDWKVRIPVQPGDTTSNGCDHWHETTISEDASTLVVFNSIDTPAEWQNSYVLYLKTKELRILHSHFIAILGNEIALFSSIVPGVSIETYLLQTKEFRLNADPKFVEIFENWQTPWSFPYQIYPLLRNMRLLFYRTERDERSLAVVNGQNEVMNEISIEDYSDFNVDIQENILIAQIKYQQNVKALNLLTGEDIWVIDESISHLCASGYGQAAFQINNQLVLISSKTGEQIAYSKDDQCLSDFIFDSTQIFGKYLFIGHLVNGGRGAIRKVLK